MKFSRSSSIPVAKVGAEHLSWQSKLALEHKSTLVSIERSIKEGLINPSKVQDMLHTADWMQTESFHKPHDNLSPVRANALTGNEEPYERFPRMFEEGAVRGFRRGYYAPWTRSQFELTQHLTPTDNKSVRQLILERSHRKAYRQQQDRARKLSTEKFPRNASQCNSPERRGDAALRKKTNSVCEMDAVARRSPDDVKLPTLKKKQF